MIISFDKVSKRYNRPRSFRDAFVRALAPRRQQSDDALWALREVSFAIPWAARFRRATDPWHRLAAAEPGQKHAEPAPIARAPAAAGAAPPSGQVRNPAGPVLVISHDVVGDTMAGPGIRYYHLARVLAREFEVILAVPGASSLASAPGFSVLPYADLQAPALEAAIERARVVVVPGVAVAGIPALGRAGVPIAVDGHNPFQAETLFLREAEASDQGAVLTAAYLLGDFFFCASERQRDWWLGLLEANGRINSFTYREDPSLRRLVDLVPYGLPSSPPQATQPVLKGVRPGIGREDKVLLWGGGLWPWLDPLTAIRALGLLRPQRSDLRLVLPGTAHPNPAVARLPNLLTAARDLARELGLLERAVFFVDWVPYAQWPNFLLESDVGLTLHRRDTLEARLAYRTRVLDYVWAGLPTVATRGDVLADLLVEHRLGAVVEPEDPAAVAEAILQTLAVGWDGAAERFAEVRQALRWEVVAQPLVEFCRQPRLAPDKLARGASLGNQYYTSRIADLEARIRWYDSHRMVKLARQLEPLVLRWPWLRRWVRS